MKAEEWCDLVGWHKVSIIVVIFVVEGWPWTTGDRRCVGWSRFLLSPSQRARSACHGWVGNTALLLKPWIRDRSCYGCSGFEWSHLRRKLLILSSLRYLGYLRVFKCNGFLPMSQGRLEEVTWIEDDLSLSTKWSLYIVDLLPCWVIQWLIL